MSAIWRAVSPAASSSVATVFRNVRKVTHSYPARFFKAGACQRPLCSWQNLHCALGVRLAPVPARAGRPEAGQQLVARAEQREEMSSSDGQANRMARTAVRLRFPGERPAIPSTSTRAIAPRQGGQTQPNVPAAR
ncbi:hypothetical protein GCM10027436_11360 [Actinophytocola sediminis]